jgi:hypothetical protein
MPRFIASALTLVAAVAAAPPQNGLAGGVKIGLTENFLDYTVSVVKPAALNFLRHFQFPDPVVSGDDFSISWSVGSVQLGNIDADFELDLITPSSLAVKITNLQLDVSAAFHAREDVWPHPSINLGIAGDADGTSASATVSVPVGSSGVPQVSLDSCSPDVHVNNFHITGGLIWPFDKLADLVINAFKGSIQSKIGSMLCDDGIRDELISQIVNPFLSSWTYQIGLPFPPPWDQSVLDYHLTGSPVVAGSDPNNYLDAAATGRISLPSTSAPLPLPTMTTLTPAQLGSHMLTGQLSPFLFNTGLYVFAAEGLLYYTVTRSELPSALQGLLNTDFFRLILPKLSDAYPHQDMQMNVSITNYPNVSIGTDTAAVHADVQIDFQVVNGSAANGSIEAFSLLCPFEAAASLGISNSTSSPAVTGSVHNVSLQLFPGHSSFGNLGPEIISLLSVPVNTIFNELIIPLVNQVIGPGVPIPTIDQTIAGYHITVEVANPTIALMQGYALVGTDLDISITPPSYL